MTIPLGRIHIDRVAELDHWVFPAAELFPGIGPDGPSEVDLSITTHVIRTEDLVVLVDAGNGNGKERPVLSAHHGFDTDYADRLAAVDVDPDDVDIVVLTHLHPDHCGGATRLVDGRWVPTFRRARHLVAQAELAWLEGVAADAPTDGVPADLARTYADSVAPLAEAGLLHPVELPHRIDRGITLRALPGHTAGHLVVEVSGGGRKALITGDAVHHPLQLADPGLAQAGDADPALAAGNRRTLLTEAAENGIAVLPAHFGGRYGVLLRRDGDGFAHVPL